MSNRPLHGGADGFLDTLQIQAAGGRSIAENDTQQLIYFAGDLLLDGLSRFFPGRSAGLLPLAGDGRSCGSRLPTRRRAARTCDIRQSRSVPEIEGVRITPGDLVFGDIDGVVIIPRDMERDVLEKALEKARGEKLVRKAIEGGMSSTDAFGHFGITAPCGVPKSRP